MPVVRLKEFRTRQAGVYIISPQPPTDDIIMFKIGRTIQMNKRLNSYHLCFPDGFYIYKALMLNDTYKAPITKTNQKTRLKADKLNALALTIKIEKIIHDKLEPYRHKSTTRTKHEWFTFTGGLEEIDKALIACHNENKAETDYPIIQFSNKGFYDYFYIDEIEEMKIAKTRLKIVEEVPSYMGGGVDIPKVEGAHKASVRKSGRVRKTPAKFKDSVFFDISKSTSKNWS